jgi:hypothetical protein
MSDAEIKRRAKAGQELLRALSGQMLEQWRARQFFPSTDASDRKSVSPLGGQAVEAEKVKPQEAKPKAKRWVW